MTREALRDEGLWVAVVAAFGVVGLGLYWSELYLHNVCDDSLISLHYARNVAEGRGFVFNVGERVEGYTNFLWVALTALLYPLSDGTGEGFVRLATWLSIGFSAASVVLAYLVARRAWGRGLLTALLAVGLCAADNDYSVWALHGMELHLLTFTMLCSMLFWWSGSGRRSAVTAGVFLALAVMTRPDAALWPIALFASELVALTGSRESAVWQRFILAFATAALLYGIYFAWRFHYFGYVLPNTYYLKAHAVGTGGIERGIEYLLGFLRTRAFVPVLALGAVFVMRDRVARALLVWGLMHVAYVVYVGGDFYDGHRFFVVLIPVLGLLIGGLFEQAQKGSPDARYRWLVPVAGGLVVGVVAAQSWARGPGRNDIAPYGHVIDWRRRVAKYLGENAPEGASIAAEFLGETGYYARLRVYDVYGIIDPDVSHRQVEGFGRGSPGHEKSATVEETLRRRPTFIRHRFWRRDFYEDGYFFDPMFPDELGMPGIWRADEMGKTGVWLEAGRIPFEEGPYEGWSTSGEAFERWPTRAPTEEQVEARGAKGWYLSSYDARRGNRPTGQILSTPFELRGDLLVLRVGGGRDHQGLKVELLVGDSVVHRATGPQSSILARRAWDIRALRGEQARLRVVDASSEAFGNISVDEIRQWRRTADTMQMDRGQQ